MAPKKNSKKLYKALMLDVDGTIIQMKRNAIPSKAVTTAIEQASKKIHVGLATSRPYPEAKHIFEHLSLSSYSVVNGGAQILDATLKQIVWEQPLEEKDIKTVCSIIRENNFETEKTFKKHNVNLPFWLNDGEKDIDFSDGSVLPKKVLQVYLQGLHFQDADMLTGKLSHIPTISIHKVPSWVEGKSDLLIGHASATKQHGIFEVAKRLQIETEDIIGVGDGYNDFPLLMACGLKVAMGNAVEDLKAIADYVAPTVDNDGVADVIKKFVL